MLVVGFLGYVIFIGTCMYATTLGAEDDSGGDSVNEPIKIFARRLQSCNFQNKRYRFIHNGEKSHDEILIEKNLNPSKNAASSVPSSARTVIVYEINPQYRDVS